MYAGYKTSEGVASELLSQFPILEEGLEAMESWFGRWFTLKQMMRLLRPRLKPRWMIG